MQREGENPNRSRSNTCLVDHQIFPPLIIIRCHTPSEFHCTYSCTFSFAILQEGDREIERSARAPLLKATSVTHRGRGVGL